jgi:hypothetical protein
VVLARSIFHQVGTSQFDDRQIKKNIEIMKTTKKKLKKKHQKITLSSRLATGVTQATQCICNQDDLKKNYDVSLEYFLLAD